MCACFPWASFLWYPKNNGTKANYGIPMSKYKESKKLLVLLMLAWVLTPFSADAAHGRPKLIQKSNYKLAYSKANHGKTSRLSRKGPSSRHERLARNRAATENAANYADFVMDAKTGQVLHSTDPDALRHPASLTKMMTLYLTFEALKEGRLSLSQELPISQRAASQEPSKLGLRPGSDIRVEDALLGLVVKSANDATVVLAEALGGSEEEFARMMTSKARELGMERTVFRNPSGLPDPQQVTTARDMAKLGQALIYNFPQFYPYFSRDSFSYGGVRHGNHNRLMGRYRGMDGIKTGFIRASGFNLVASTVRGQRRLIAVVFGGRSAVSRDNKMAVLLDQSYAQLLGEQPVQSAGLTDEGGSQEKKGGVSALPLEQRPSARLVSSRDSGDLRDGRKGAVHKNKSDRRFKEALRVDHGTNNKNIKRRRGYVQRGTVRLAANSL